MGDLASNFYYGLLIGILASCVFSLIAHKIHLSLKCYFCKEEMRKKREEFHNNLANSLKIKSVNKEK